MKHSKISLLCLFGFHQYEHLMTHEGHFLYDPEHIIYFSGYECKHCKKYMQINHFKVDSFLYCDALKHILQEEKGINHEIY